MSKKKTEQKDSLGNRMKGYEDVTRTYLPRRSYVLIRIDGKAFHSYTRGFDKPFDMGLIEDMDETAKYLCKHIQGAVCTFVQSDEISILVTDFKDIKTSAWFDNNVQKMCSVSASMVTSKFNHLRLCRIVRNWGKQDKIDIVDIDKLSRLAEFDSRVYQIPSKTEVANYFIWRQQDTTRNSISSVGHFLFSDKELDGKSCNEMQEMIFQKGINWNDYDAKLKRGRMIVKKEYYVMAGDNNLKDNAQKSCYRTKWESISPPIFTEDKEYLNNLIPINY